MAEEGGKMHSNGGGGLLLKPVIPWFWPSIQVIVFGEVSREKRRMYDWHEPYTLGNAWF